MPHANAHAGLGGGVRLLAPPPQPGCWSQHQPGPPGPLPTDGQVLLVLVGRQHALLRLAHHAEHVRLHLFGAVRAHACRRGRGQGGRQLQAWRPALTWGQHSSGMNMLRGAQRLGQAAGAAWGVLILGRRDAHPPRLSFSAEVSRLNASLTPCTGRAATHAWCANAGAPSDAWLRAMVGVRVVSWLPSSGTPPRATHQDGIRRGHLHPVEPAGCQRASCGQPPHCGRGGQWRRLHKAICLHSFSTFREQCALYYRQGRLAQQVSCHASDRLALNPVWPPWMSFCSP